MQLSSESGKPFSQFCSSFLDAFDALKFFESKHEELNLNQKFILDATALLLNAPMEGCTLLMSANGSLLRSPSHPSSLNALSDLQQQGLLRSRFIQLGSNKINDETIELLRPILDSFKDVSQPNEHAVFDLLMDLISPYVSEGKQFKGSLQKLELHESSKKDATDAVEKLQEIETSVHILEQHVSSKSNELDAQMAHFQTNQRETLLVQTVISQLASGTVDLQVCRSTMSMKKDVAVAGGPMPSETACLQILQPHSTTAHSQLVQHCASLAAFTTFGGLLSEESRIKFLNSLKGIGHFSCSKTKKTSLENENGADQTLNYLHAVADEATLLLWQQCGIPKNDELFTSISLILASPMVPFVFDKTGLVLEFLRNMSHCNHSLTYDRDAPVPPPQTDCYGAYRGVLVRSTREFPIFARTCPTTCSWTDLGRGSGAGCVVMTLPDTRSKFEEIVSACTYGRLLVFHIPAQHSHASAAIRSLQDFIQLLVLPKHRKAPQSILMKGRMLTVNIRFACIIVNESNMQPLIDQFSMMSVVHFTPGREAMQQVLLHNFVLRKNVSLMTSLCVMRQRLLCSLVDRDIIKMRLFDDFKCLSKLCSGSQNQDYDKDNVSLSAGSTGVISRNLASIDNCCKLMQDSTATMQRVQSLLLQLNSTLADMLSHVSQYIVSLDLTEAIAATNACSTNVYQVFFSLFCASFIEPNSNSNPKQREKMMKSTNSNGTSSVLQIFRSLCLLVPQKIRLPVILFALQNWMGGKHGLHLLINVPFPLSSSHKKYVKSSQNVAASISNSTAAASNVSTSSKLSVSLPKKNGKGNFSNTAAIASVVLPDTESTVTQNSLLGPAWMPPDTFRRLVQV
jgi:hypothetical protein